MRTLRMKLAHWLPGRWLVMYGGTVVDVAFLSKSAAEFRAIDYSAARYLKTGKYSTNVSIHRAHTRKKK